MHLTHTSVKQSVLLSTKLDALTLLKFIGEAHVWKPLYRFDLHEQQLPDYTRPVYQGDLERGGAYKLTG